jgi:hypothetical protein
MSVVDELPVLNALGINAAATAVAPMAIMAVRRVCVVRRRRFDFSCAQRSPRRTSRRLTK